MISLLDSKPKELLCLGAHCDDIEIGCGGTVLKWIRKGWIEKVCWVIFSSTATRAEEAKASAQHYLKDVPDSKVIIKDYRDAYLPYSAQEIKDFVQSLHERCSPDIIFTHFRHDRHQDHRLVSDLTYNAFRDHFILEYEIPKYDGDLGQPNMYVEIPKELVDLKIDWLLHSYPTQAKKNWFDNETFAALLRIRGLECHSPSRYAEAFHARKWVI